MFGDYDKTGINKRFVNGVSVPMHNNVAALIIESSSYNENKNVKHMITDTLKSLKNASDSSLWEKRFNYMIS